MLIVALLLTAANGAIIQVLMDYSLARERSTATAWNTVLRRLPAYSGTATSWQNYALPGSTAFVVELPAGPLGKVSVTRHAHAVLTLAAIM